MLINKNVSIVAISDIKLKETIFALTKSSQSLNPKKCLLFTSKIIYLNKYQSKLINIIRINPINSIKEYSNFIIYELHQYLETSHSLIVQWDGYICNEKEWNPDFLTYDYIGAPFIPRDSDNNYSRDMNGNFHIIGNGGFSLRSKRLLEAPEKYDLKDNLKFTNSHEDGFFCVLHRNFLESKGFRWAPFNVAIKFSIESPLSFQDLIELPFGFHGKKMLVFINLKQTLRNLIKFLFTN